MFITFEGTEGSGKTTQINHLANKLSDACYSVQNTREPGGSNIGDQIREILLSTANEKLSATSELLLYAASRAQHVREIIVPALKNGKIVISDRFSDATVAYQGYGRNLDLVLINHLNQIATDGLAPDITFLLNLPVEIGLQRASISRGKLDRIERESLEFHERVQNGYLSIAKEDTNRIKIIDATQPIDVIFNEIWSILKVKISLIKVNHDH